jgi:hypothetical protein
MVKAEDFWKHLCEELDYRFFSGVICPGLLPLYKKMNSKRMHYVPAVNERIGLGLVSGACMAGLNSGLLIDMDFAYDLTKFIRFNINNKLPLLVIGSGNKDTLLAYDFPSEFIDNDKFEDKLVKVSNLSNKIKVPGLIVIGEGVLV